MHWLARLLRGPQCCRCLLRGGAPFFISINYTGTGLGLVCWTCYTRTATLRDCRVRQAKREPTLRLLTPKETVHASH